MRMFRSLNAWQRFAAQKHLTVVLLRTVGAFSYYQARRADGVLVGLFSSSPKQSVGHIDVEHLAH